MHLCCMEVCIDQVKNAIIIWNVDNKIRNHCLGSKMVIVDSTNKSVCRCIFFCPYLTTHKYYFKKWSLPWSYSLKLNLNINQTYFNTKNMSY